MNSSWPLSSLTADPSASIFRQSLHKATNLKNSLGLISRKRWITSGAGFSIYTLPDSPGSGRLRCRGKTYTLISICAVKDRRGGNFASCDLLMGSRSSRRTTPMSRKCQVQKSAESRIYAEGKGAKRGN